MGELNLNGPLTQELISRYTKGSPLTSEPAPEPLATPSTISPKNALILGGLADAASTYGFLKNGSGVEDNAMVGFAKNSPIGTGLAAAGGTLGALLIHKLLSKKMPKLADTLAGGLGGYQTTLAGWNTDSTPGIHVGDMLDMDRINNKR